MEDYKNLAMLAPKERYEQQLDDTRWKLKANNIRKRDNHECQICGAKKRQLDVHHIRYVSGREAWDYDDGDLVTLCHECHEEIHDWQDFENLIEGDYYYGKTLEGVGVVERKYYSIESIIYDFGKHLKTLLPDKHPIRIKARNCFKEAINN